MFKPKIYKVLTLLLVVCFTFSFGVKPIAVNAFDEEDLFSVTPGLFSSSSVDPIMVYIPLYLYCLPYFEVYQAGDTSTPDVEFPAYFFLIFCDEFGYFSDETECFDWIYNNLSFNDDGYLVFSRDLVHYLSLFADAMHEQEFYVPGSSFSSDGIIFFCYDYLPVYETEFLSSVDEVVLDSGDLCAETESDFFLSFVNQFGTVSFSVKHIPIDHYSESLTSGYKQFVAVALAACSVGIPVLGVYCVIRLMRRFL